MKPITMPPVTSPCTTRVNSATEEGITRQVTAVTPSASGSDLANWASRISIPMMNSSINTPSSARVSMLLSVWISPAPEGPKTTPTRMKPAAAGRRSRFMNNPQATAAAKTRARAERFW